MRRFYLFCLCFYGITVWARVMQNYTDANGFPNLVPAPQIVQKQPGAFVLPKKLGWSAPAGQKIPQELVRNELQNRFPEITLLSQAKGNISLLLTTQKVPESDEGYRLEITPSGVTIASRDDKGLYYGVQTLCNFIRNCETPALPCCRISDWPDMKIRGIYLNVSDQYVDPLKSETVPAFCELMRLMASLKLNTLNLEFNSNLPFANHPFIRKTTLTEADVEMILQTAEEHHLEIIPFLQVMTHDTWLRKHPDYAKITARPNVRGWGTMICLESQKAREVLDYTIRETVRILQCKRFSPVFDEPKWCHWEQCDHCPHGHRQEQFIREYLHYVDLLKSLGQEIFVSNDTLQSPRVGIVSPLAAPLLAVVPRDLVINMWDYREWRTEFDAFDYFTRRGFSHQVGMSHCEHLRNVMEHAQQVRARKLDGVIMTYWGHARGPMLGMEYTTPKGMAGSVINAEYAWNASPERLPFNQLPYDPTFEYRRRLEEPIIQHRRNQEKKRALSIAAQCNVALGKTPDFPILTPAALQKMNQELAQSPEGYRLEVTQEGLLGAIVLNGGVDHYPKAPVVIPVEGRCAGFSFLMTTTNTNLPDVFKNNYAHYRKVVAKLKIQYTDGTEAVKPLICGLDIHHWNYEASGYRTHFAWGGADERKYGVNLCSIDWKNPHQEKSISSIEFATESQSELAPALLAITAWSPRGTLAKPGAIPKNIWTPDAVGEPLKDKVMANDFENGLGTSVVYAGKEGIVPKADCTIVQDTAAPTPGKVLEIHLPTWKYSENLFKRNRVMIDLPVPKGVRFGTLFADYKFSDATEVVHSAMYIINLKQDSCRVTYGLPIPQSNRWEHLELPVKTMALEGTVEVSEKNADLIRLSFWLRNKKPVTIWFDQIGISPNEVPWLPKFKYDVRPLNPAEEF